MKNNNELIYVCSQCGNEFAKWSGKCFYCNSWNTLKELKIDNNTKIRKIEEESKVQNFEEIKHSDFSKIKTRIKEVDRVLGGGIVPGSLILLGGDPGIGKSTLMMQISESVGNVLYVSGEESAMQIKMRAVRIKSTSKNIKLLTETNVDLILNQISKLISKKLNLVIIDSIQTIYDLSYPSTPGSIIQVRECALKLQKFAKKNHLPLILVGHVTKEGNVAGPKTLEHLVDVVLYLEGEKYHNSRILRGIKNRFGATDEIGIFEMGEKGFTEVKNPSEIFLKERLIDIPGSVVTAMVEGTRPFLVEIQALTAPTVFGYPKRTSSGFDLNRLQLLAAVLVKRGGINLLNHDIYLNVVGGFKIKEPAADLAVCLAIASAYKNIPVISKLCVFGEVGLSGEIRSVNYFNKRVEEAKRLGFDKVIKAKTVNEIIKEGLKNNDKKNC